MATIFGIIGTIASAAASGSAAKAQAEYTARAAEYNAQLAENNAAYARQIAQANAEKQRYVNQKKLGQIRGQYAASGVEIEGSPLDVIDESIANSELEAAELLHEGELRAISFQNEARLERFKASNARSEGKRAASSALLGGVLKIGGSLARGGF